MARFGANAEGLAEDYQSIAQELVNLMAAAEGLEVQRAGVAMPDVQTEPPRLGTVAFRESATAYPTGAHRYRLNRQSSASRPNPRPSGATSPPAASPSDHRPDSHNAVPTGVATSQPQPARQRQAAARQDARGIRTRVGTGQLQARVPLDLAQLDQADRHC